MDPRVVSAILVEPCGIQRDECLATGARQVSARCRGPRVVGDAIGKQAGFLCFLADQLGQPASNESVNAATSADLAVRITARTYRWIHNAVEYQRFPLSAAKKVVLRPRIFARRTHWEGRGASRARSPGKTAADRRKHIMTTRAVPYPQLLDHRAHRPRQVDALGDRILELTGTVAQRDMQDQLLDSHGHRARARHHHQEPGRARASYTADDGETYQFNLIDTPGPRGLHLRGLPLAGRLRGRRARGGRHPGRRGADGGQRACWP